jgi:hypothetical protein
MTEPTSRTAPVDYSGWFPAPQANFWGEIVSGDGADRQQRHTGDLVMITRADDRSVEATEMREPDDSEIGESRALEPGSLDQSP